MRLCNKKEQAENEVPFILTLDLTPLKEKHPNFKLCIVKVLVNGEISHVEHKIEPRTNQNVEVDGVNSEYVYSTNNAYYPCMTKTDRENDEKIEIFFYVDFLNLPIPKIDKKM